MKVFALFTTALCLALLPLRAHASIELASTRVIYAAAAKSVTVQATNRDASPYLVKVWIDHEDTADAENSAVPFVVTPPLARVEPGDSQALRIARVTDIAPTDRESVYWLNVLAIPPNSQEKLEGKNVLQFAVRTRIKIFYRPAGLAGDANDAPSALTWRIVDDKGEWFLECQNPTPYHVNMAELAMAGQEPVSSILAHPFASTRMKLARAPTRGAVLEGVLSTVNDYGGLVELPLRVVAGD